LIYLIAMKSLRDIPSVDLILQSPPAEGWINNYGRPLTLQAIRDVLTELRSNFKQKQSLPDLDEIYRQIDAHLIDWSTPSLVPVINASGVILHTNLGRAPLSRSALQAIYSVSSGYSNLEYDLDRGQRGSRLIHAESLLQRITGAPAALVVNNNAAAVMLVLTCLAKRRSVVIARTQLVEIGGGFRVPDVMKQSGARLVEVGTTNRVHLSDYQQAIDEQHPALLMRAHRSNFRLIGFTSEPSLEEIVVLARQSNIPVVDDLGSGTLLDTAAYGMAHEPTINESLSAGADLVCFSGDKLLGGPQAGIIIGRSDLVLKIRKHPLARALRADKLCLSALSATLLHYLKDEAEREVPVWRMISSPLDILRQRAERLSVMLAHGEIIETQSTVGGGSLPGEILPTYALALSVPSPNHLMEKLRKSATPVIARLDEQRVILDLRTVLPELDDELISTLKNCLS
jgi:L-seryl-tRNA(Ser) seleniumtransferase